VITETSHASAAGLLKRAALRFRGVDDEVESYLASPAALSFVATSESEVTGWCWGYVLPRPDGAAMAYLHELEVVEKHQRQGIGRDLLSAFMAGASRRGASKMFLSTGKENTGARALYARMGGELAAQGPTVNYWFQLPAPPAGGGPT
jgi:ribosomal protein S18 acetylase RimI-like enzyme